MIRFAVSGAAVLLLAGCLPGGVRRELERFEGELLRSDSRLSSPSGDAELDRSLGGTLELETLVAIALARNPELREAWERARAALEEVRVAGSLDDPMLRIGADGVPIRKPAGIDRNMENAVMLSQAFPFPGVLGLRADSALWEAEAAYQEYRGRERELVARVKTAFYEYYAVTRELAIHWEHQKILEEFEKISDAKFRTGTAMQQDVLKPQVEIVVLHSHLLFIEERLAAARARINALLNRSPHAPLGSPKEVTPSAEVYDPRELEAMALRSRPELLAARFKVGASAAAAELARREARYPGFSVELGYQQIPRDDDAYEAALSINLPWLSGRRSAEERRRKHLLRADEAAVEGARNQAALEVREAFLRFEAARKAERLFRGELLAKSRQGLEVSRAGYEKDKSSFLDLLDAERMLREAELQHVKSVAGAESARAELERAVGIDLGRKP